MAALDLEEVIGQAIDVFGLREDALLRGKRGHRNLQRLVTLLACRARTPSPAAVIAERFFVQPGTIADLARRVRELTGRDDAAAACQRELEQRLVEIIHQSTT
ncbi:MAG: hypothetical protein JW797_07340 [Bradymonadales bacterium]|nr:hypothetical protein [Bradymonadales bacterium]